MSDELPPLPPFSNPCVNHTHPRLVTPLSALTFEQELWELWDVAKRAARRTLDHLPTEPPIRFTLALDAEHYRNARRFAEVQPEVAHFAFSHAVLHLHAPYRLGVLAHEVGHVLCAYGVGCEVDSESGADDAARSVLKVSIGYDQRNFPGRGLQRGTRVE